ncbi:efflux transporter periplasmic adaptor subunit (plasmid) [Azospirillum sp. TSH58]|uniref:efflux RND transporter periplasmic adaptor subunit n=1 Tax=Azospirillum sp. TSH58 TaxID=664962 RepID=UPI000D6011A8|nr:efflux RND transporter periplasmic adaptor subunit [Azospirillum sp. TSH58]AWJ87989.1 efflux transporter periplasmic adaptor subunit [Azospirillum sp. TSH58]
MTELLPRKTAVEVDALLGLDRSPRTVSGAARIGRKWLLAILLLAPLAVAAHLLLRSSADTPRYATEPTVRGDLHVIVTATGSVQPTSQIEVSSELSGTVRRVLVDYNSVVAAGQMLAELDTDKFKASVDSSRAKLTAAKAKVVQAEVTVVETARELDRKQSLVRSRAGTLQNLDVARALHDRAVAALANARADVGVAEAELTLNESNLHKTGIVSPIDGIVLKRNVDPGQTVAATLQAPVLFSIAEDLRRMEVQVDVDEADVGKVREGQSARFSVDAHPDHHFPAVIRDLRYAPETVQGVVTYKAILTVDNSAMLLRPGMTATAEIGVQDVAGALLVPNPALRFTPPAEAAGKGDLLKRMMPGMPQFRPPSPQDPSGPSRTVWTLRDGVPVEVAVVTGASDGRRTEILQGDLTEGAAVIVDTATPR